MSRLFKWSKRLIIFATVFTALVVIARLLFPLPILDGRNDSYALAPSETTHLGSLALADSEKYPGKSGVFPLFDGAEAYGARILMARAAQASIDVRYYIWKRDLTGLPLLQELRAAAQRGVRVRLLVDDNGTPDLDIELAALNALKNMEVRVFNPFNLRNPRAVSYLFDFPRLNRRMHNKSFTVDSAATIVGGRNVGDNYFSRNAETQFSDFDLLLTAQAAVDAGVDFDHYWNSRSAYPHELLMESTADGLSTLDIAVAEARAAPGWDAYKAEIRNSELITSIMAKNLVLEWAHVTLLSDDPAKGLGSIDDSRLLIASLSKIISEAKESIDLISAYFIPGDIGTDLLTSAARKGLSIRTLTNSLSATDVLPVHAGYLRYRDKLIDAGVEVYELKDTQSPTQADALGLFGSSASSLHAKSVAIDAKRLFVGSFNFDPRSTYLNCEMGFLVESETLAGQLRDRLENNLDEYAWHVRRNQNGQLQWDTINDEGNLQTETKEPGSSFTARIFLHLIATLPVEWML